MLYIFEKEVQNDLSYISQVVEAQMKVVDSVYLSAMDYEKIVAIEKFSRRGGTRRQDHGTWANTSHGKSRWHDESRFYFNQNDIERFELRQIVRRGGIEIE